MLAAPLPVPDVLLARRSPSRQRWAAVVESPAAPTSSPTSSPSPSPPGVEPRTLHVWADGALTHAIDLAPHVAGVYTDGNP
jgi:hypothetical protein